MQNGTIEFFSKYFERFIRDVIIIKKKIERAFRVMYIILNENNFTN